MKSKISEVATINLVQAQIEEMSLYLILSVALLLYQEGCHLDYKQSLNGYWTNKVSMLIEKPKTYERIFERSTTLWVSS
jgi:hypothetical protein